MSRKNLKSKEILYIIILTHFTIIKQGYIYFFKKNSQFYLWKVGGDDSFLSDTKGLDALFPCRFCLHETKIPAHAPKFCKSSCIPLLFAAKIC